MILPFVTAVNYAMLHACCAPLYAALPTVAAGSGTEAAVRTLPLVIELSYANSPAASPMIFASKARGCLHAYALYHFDFIHHIEHCLITLNTTLNTVYSTKPRLQTELPPKFRPVTWSAYYVVLRHSPH